VYVVAIGIVREAFVIARMEVFGPTTTTSGFSDTSSAAMLANRSIFRSTTAPRNGADIGQGRCDFCFAKRNRRVRQGPDIEIVGIHRRDW